MLWFNLRSYANRGVDDSSLQPPGCVKSRQPRRRWQWRDTGGGAAPPSASFSNLSQSGWQRSPLPRPPLLLPGDAPAGSWAQEPKRTRVTCWGARTPGKLLPPPTAPKRSPSSQPLWQNLAKPYLDPLELPGLGQNLP